MNKIEKLLGVLKSTFDLKECPTSIKGVLQKERDATEDKDTFVYLFFNTFCGRANNEFVDYELLAIYLKRFLGKMPANCDFAISEYGHNVSERIVYYLLFDDRHDCYQNVPETLIEFVEQNKHIINIQDFWTAVSDCCINSFNVNGTGDSTIQ